MLTCGHPAVAVADAEAAAELAKEKHELGRTSAREGRKEGKEDLEEMEDATKKENNATRFTTPDQRRPIPAFKRASVTSLQCTKKGLAGRTTQAGGKPV